MITVIGQDIFYDGQKVALITLPEIGSSLRVDFVGDLEAIQKGLTAEDVSDQVEEGLEDAKTEGYNEGVKDALDKVDAGLSELEDTDRAKQIVANVREELAPEGAVKS